MGRAAGELHPPGAGSPARYRSALLAWCPIGSGVWKASSDSEGRTLQDVLENFEILLVSRISVGIWKSFPMSPLVNKSNRTGLVITLHFDFLDFWKEILIFEKILNVN